MIPILETHNHIPPAIIKRLPQHGAAGRRVPNTILGVEYVLREVGDRGQADDPIVVRVVVARVDARIELAAHAGAAPAAGLVAERRLGRVVLAQVGDAVLDARRPGVLVAGDIAADDVCLLGKRLLAGGFVVVKGGGGC